MRRCPKCGHPDGIINCPVCHDPANKPLAKLFPEPAIRGTCSVIDNGTPELQERVARLRSLGWHVTVWKGAKREAQ